MDQFTKSHQYRLKRRFSYRAGAVAKSEDADLTSMKRIIVETHEGITGVSGIERCIEHLKQAGLHKVDELCWNSVLVFDRDGSAESIRPL